MARARQSITSINNPRDCQPTADHATSFTRRPVFSVKRPVNLSLSHPSPIPKVLESEPVSESHTINRPTQSVDKDAMERGWRLGRQPLFRNRQHLRLGAGPHLLELGRARELLLLFSERVFSTARRADLLRWQDPQDMSPQACVIDSACSGSPRGRCHVYVCLITENEVRHMSAPGYAAGIGPTKSGAAQNWLRKFDLLAVSATAVYEHRLLITFRIFEKLRSQLQFGGGTSECCNERYSRRRQTVSSSVTVGRADDSRQLGRWNLALPERLVREKCVTATPCLHQETRPNFTLQNFCDKLALQSSTHVQGSTHTYLSPQQHIKGHESSYKLCCRGPIKAVGDGRLFEAWIPTIGEKESMLEALMEQQDWDDLLTDRWPGPDATKLNNDHQISPTPRRVKAAPTTHRQYK